MTLRPASDRSWLVTFGGEISETAHREVRRATGALAGLHGVVNLHPAYTSVLVEFDPRRITAEAVENAIRERLAAAGHMPDAASRLVEVPVHYDGIDLPDVAELTGLTAAQVIERHAAAEYLVYFLGFSPGFAYLGGMPPELAAPRLQTPRRHVRAGSVAIGGAQTGIYPVDSPGGWRIIGNTPLRLFDPAADPPVRLAMGDRVRFVPVQEARS
jgi:KipI family sensor histidine kinase inhibitor